MQEAQFVQKLRASVGEVLQLLGAQLTRLFDGLVHLRGTWLVRAGKGHVRVAVEKGRLV